MSTAAAEAKASFSSVPEMWNHRVGSTPNADAMYYRDGDNWPSISWKQADERVQAVANALLAFGLKHEERCGILANTSIDWIIADMGVVSAAGATTTVYPSNTAEECEYILNNCEAVLCFVENDMQAAKLIEQRDKLTNLRQIIVFDGKATADGFVKPLSDFETEGKAFGEQNPSAVSEAQAQLTPKSLATLIYTSGTTGKPKGVMLDHAAWVYEAEAIDKMGFISPADTQFLFLPLSHVFAKVMQVIFIRLGVPTAVDGSIDRLIENIGMVKPTWMGAVPRVFEKAYNKIVSGARDGGPVKNAIFTWARKVGSKVSQLRQQGKEPTGLLKFQYSIADRLVFSKVKERFGGRLRFLISGGAPLPKEIGEFFHTCDILILEGYGLSESSAASVVNRPDDYKFGTVGRPLPGTEVRIAEDGEIMMKGPGIMQGYYKLPDATKSTLTDDGWLHTGDIGKILDTGHLKITDRKKEIIITAGGKNVAPAHFQNLLKARSTYVSQVVMHGDKRNFCSALVTINEETVGKYASDNGISFKDYADLSAKPEIHALIEQDIAAVNSELPSYEQVKKFALLPEDFTVENGMLTPSMKTKRRIIEGTYQSVLDGFYEGTVAKL